MSELVKRDDHQANSQGGPVAPFTPSHLGAVQPTTMPASAYAVIEDLFQPKGPSLKDFLTLLKKRRKVLFSTALVILGLGIFYAVTAEDQFTATSVVEIRGYSPVIGEGQFENVLQNDTRKVMYQTTTIAKLSLLGLADDVLSTNDLGLAIKKYQKKQKSTLATVKADLLRLVGLGKKDNHLDQEDPRFVHHQSFISSYLKLIQIHPIHETSLVQIRATTTDRRLSQRIANEHAEGLIRLLADERRTELNGKLSTLKTHSDELQKKLAESEAAVVKYAEQNQLVGMTGGPEGNLMVSHLTELNKFLSAAQAQRAETQGRITKLDKQSGSPLLDDETVRDLRTKLKDAESEYAALSQLVTGEYPKLVELQGKIGSLQNTIRKEREGNLVALRTEYESNVESEKLLLKQFEDQLKKAHEMSTQLVQYNLLKREAESLRDLTQTVLKSLNETKVGASTFQDNVFISDYAALPRSPSAPRRKIIIIFSLVLGLLAGVGLAIVREVVDNTIKVSDDAQSALGMPTLGIIPSFKAVGAKNLIDREKTLFEKALSYLPEPEWVVKNIQTKPGRKELNPRIGLIIGADAAQKDSIKSGSQIEVDHNEFAQSKAAPWQSRLAVKAINYASILGIPELISFLNKVFKQVKYITGFETKKPRASNSGSSSQAISQSDVDLTESMIIDSIRENTSEIKAVTDSDSVIDTSDQLEELEVVATTSRLQRAALGLPEAGVLDALWTLRANILFSSTQNSSRVIMVASAREREGKTSVISNLAVTFARASQRTILIDGDLRRPKVGRRFGIDMDHPGLVDYLAGQAGLDEVLVQSKVSNLTILPAGSPTLNATELLGSAKMAELIAVLRDQYDVVFIDAAPVLPVADSLMLAQFAESVIFVVRSGKTEKSVAQEAVRRLKRVGARVRGTVLNDFDPGERSYSNDRYSVSKYKLTDDVRTKPIAGSGLANNDAAGPKQAVG